MTFLKTKSVFDATGSARISLSHWCLHRAERTLAQAVEADLRRLFRKREKTLPFGLCTISCKWEIQSPRPNETISYLVVVGSGKKKMLKQFSAWELSNCQVDHNLQGDFRNRLLKILDFFRSSVSRSQ